jgi:hypothetical protein
MKMKTRILKNGKGQYVAQVYESWAWGWFGSWSYLSYFPISGNILKLSASFSTPRNEYSYVLEETLVKELFDSEEEAQKVIDDYLAATTFTEV